MPSDIKIEFGNTRGKPEAYFRVLVSRDGEQNRTPVLVMKKDDRDGPNKSDRPYRVEWAATKELGRAAEAALAELEPRYSAKDTKNKLEKFLKGVSRHYLPPDAEIPVDLNERIADSPITRGMHAGKEPLAPWEQEHDAAVRHSAGLRDRASDEEDVRMPELFQWVPWFEELAVKVGEVRREGLVQRAKEVDWAEGRCAVLAQGDEKADPLTFFYHLSSIAKGAARRKTVYTSVAQEFGIESDLDYGFSERFMFPQGNQVNVEFHNTGDDPNLLWDMFDQARACGPGGKSYDPAITETFAKSLQVKGVGISKLTQVLFLINPRAFLPFDKNALLPLGIGRFSTPPPEMSWAEYFDEMGRIRTAFPGCQPYELNVIGYLWTNGFLPRKGKRWYQIGTSDAGWREFRDNNWIHQGGLGNMPRPGDGEVLPGPKHGNRLDEPEPGDVVLVRSGTREGRGIGIVYRNDHAERSHPNGRIHVLWVNKKQAPLAATMPPIHFSRAGRSAYEVFAKSVAYSPTLDLLSPPPEPKAHQLNQILYGPPGTGKTYHATTCAMAIVKGIEVDEVTEEHRAEFRSLRFDPTTETGRIAMVTFHQNFSYEDFVEGIRPRLAEGGDIGYELRPGLFRRIADAALADPDSPYVLIIDEINRGNVPKILGDLITLIEPSRRLRQQEETTVTLPYSGDTFGVPGNLHIIGTMNTADRSILPLDTALRRRFDHVEMLPDPGHPLIADRIAGIDLREMLKAINARISLLMDRERQIGHTYLFNVTDIESLAAKFRTAILPLLAEYFYDDWSKIRHVLGDAPFVVAKPHGDYGSGLADEGLLDPDTAIHEVLPAAAEEWLDPVQYRRIYDESVSSGDRREDESPDIGAGRS